MKLEEFELLLLQKINRFADDLERVKFVLRDLSKQVESLNDKVGELVERRG